MPGGRSQPLLQPVAAVSAVPSHILSTPLPSCLAGTHRWKWLSRLLQPLFFFFFSSNPRAGSLSGGCARFKEKPASSKDAWRQGDATAPPQTALSELQLSLWRDRGH